jgi:hypothetical protein
VRVAEESRGDRAGSSRSVDGDRQQVRVAGGLLEDGIRERDASRFRDRSGVHEVDLLDAREDALCRRDDRRLPRAFRHARERDADARRWGLRGLAEERARELREAHPRERRVRVAARRERQVHRGDERRPLQGLREHLDGLDGDTVLGLHRRGAEVRRTEHLRVLHEREVLRGLHGENVERGPAELPGVQRIDERGLVHERAARAVHEEGALLHLLELHRPEKVFRLGAARRVERDDVRLREKLVQRDRLDAQLRRTLRGHERIEGEERQVPRPQARRHPRADLPQTDEADGLALQLGPHELRPLPLPGLQRSLCLGNPA